jgi:predicted nucleic acid-binding protein
LSNNRSTKKKHYLDTCIFIGYLNQEENKFSECNAVISAASEGFIEAFTSELIGVELIKLNGFPSGAENAMNQFLDDFINKSHWLKLISFEREMARIARFLRQKYKLKPFDAMHLATAIRHGVDYFDTTDGDYWNGETKKGKLPKSVGYVDYEPVIIQRPKVEGYTIPIPFSNEIIPGLE